jgi:hypothetical protein
VPRAPGERLQISRDLIAPETERLSAEAEARDPADGLRQLMRQKRKNTCPVAVRYQ